MQPRDILSPSDCPGNMGGWKARHLRAPFSSDPFSRAWTELLTGWAEYAEAHRRRYGSPIGEDYVLGPEWGAMGKSLRALLNGEAGDFDAGSIDGRLIDYAAQHGCNLED